MSSLHHRAGFGHSNLLPLCPHCLTEAVAGILDGFKDFERRGFCFCRGYMELFGSEQPGLVKSFLPMVGGMR